MKQKIYSDRTELEGVDLPSAGQTRMLVIDENKKIKSEAKPTITTPKFDDVLGAGDVTDKEAKFQSEVSTQYSHVSNERVISGDVEKGSYTKIDYEGIEHVPHVGRGRHNVKFTEDLDDGEFEHTFPAKSGTIAHLSDIDGAINVKMFTIELTHEQVLELNTTPYNITSTDLGLQAGEKVKWLLDRCEWKVDNNGAPYDGSITLHSLSSPICTIRIKSDGHRAGMEIISNEDGYPVSDAHYLKALSTITGGTSGATVKIRLYYTTTTW